MLYSKKTMVTSKCKLQHNNKDPSDYISINQTMTLEDMILTTYQV